MNQRESEFAIEIWSASVEKLADDRWIDGVDLGQIDTFLSTGNWDEVSRTALLAERESAFASYQQGNFDVSLIKMIALNRMCQYLEYREAMRPDSKIGQEYRAEQRRKGRLGGLAKGMIEADGGKTNLASIIGRLASKRDGLGDPLRSDELWLELFGELDRLHLSPVDGDNEYTYKGKTIKYDTFKSMLSQSRSGKS